jgi:hypothetical protein
MLSTWSLRLTPATCRGERDASPRPESITVCTARQLLERHRSEPGQGRCRACARPIPCPIARHAQIVCRASTTTVTLSVVEATRELPVVTPPQR